MKLNEKWLNNPEQESTEENEEDAVPEIPVGGGD